MDKAELIGTIIDTFEDDLHNRSIINFGIAEVSLHQSDENSPGVFYGGKYYDEVVEKLKTLLKEFGI